MPDCAAFNDQSYFFLQSFARANFLVLSPALVLSHRNQFSPLKISIHSFAPFVSLCYLFNTATSATSTKRQRFLIKCMQNFKIYVFAIFFDIRQVNISFLFFIFSPLIDLQRALEIYLTFCSNFFWAAISLGPIFAFHQLIVIEHKSEDRKLTTDKIFSFVFTFLQNLSLHFCKIWVNNLTNFWLFYH